MLWQHPDLFLHGSKSNFFLLYSACVAQLRFFLTSPRAKTVDGLSVDNFLPRPYLDAQVYFRETHKEVLDQYLVSSPA